MAVKQGNFEAKTGDYQGHVLYVHDQSITARRRQYFLVSSPVFKRRDSHTQIIPALNHYLSTRLLCIPELLRDVQI